MTYLQACCCSLEECKRTGCIRQRGALSPFAPVARPGLYAALPNVGCICPPRSEETCQRKNCGRKDRTP
jgi:hypothetical protein